LKLLNTFIYSWKITRITIHLFSGLIGSLLFVRKDIDRSNKASRLFVWWNGKFCRILNAQVTTRGEMNRQATLFVMNHISWLDVPVLASQQFLHFLSKAEIKSWPFLGWFSKKAGTLYIQRGAKGASQNSLNEITQCLQNGGSVIFFPEGTTTDGSTLRKFHSRLLQSAIDAQVSIQPIALRYPYKQGINPHVAYVGDTTFINSFMNLLKYRPLHVELNFLNPITDHLDKTKETSAKQLALLAKASIAQSLNIPAA